MIYLAALVLPLAACAYQPDATTLVQLPPGAIVPAHLTPWYSQPYGDPALAAQLGLDRWYYCHGAPPENAVKVEPIYEGGTVAAPPSDPLYPAQWALANKVGTLDADVDWAPAWELIQELQDAGAAFERVKVGIVDSRMDQVRLASGEVPMSGYWQSMQGVPYPTGEPCVHAVHVASIAAAVTDNAYGIAGVCPFADILPVQVLWFCFGVQPDAAAGVIYAADQDCDSINMSLQYGYEAQSVFTLACWYAMGQGSVVVAASGNFHGALPTVPGNIPGVISVGAMDRAGKRAEFSNKGAELTAPGDYVLGLGVEWPPGPHEVAVYAWVEWSGTSMASPHVAGTAALMRSRNPSLTPQAIRTILRQTADDMGPPGLDPDYGYGRLSVYRALIAADPCPADFDLDGVVDRGDFLAFQTAFALGQHRANVTGDLTDEDAAILDVSDVERFQTLFAGGCHNP